MTSHQTPADFWHFDPELEEILLRKDVLTARDEITLNLVRCQQSKVNSSETSSFPISIKTQGEAVLACFPDGDRHEARVAPIALSTYDRIFWVNLVIACDGPKVDKVRAHTTDVVTRDFGKLENAANDLAAFKQFYRPIMLGHPGIIFHEKVGRSPGYFDYTETLENPSRADISVAVAKLSKWIAINANDPEFTSIQINLMYAGHGYCDAAGQSGIVLHDGEFASHDLAMTLLQIIPTWDDISSPSRLDMYLDCCHSGAVADDVVKTLMRDQESNPDAYKLKSRLGIGKIFCSCLDDESSLEMEELGHGLFSFAFLNEFSRRAPDDPCELEIGLRDVGWFSGVQQHPFLVDFTDKLENESLSFMFPSSRLLGKQGVGSIGASALDKARHEIIEETDPVNGEIVMSPLSIVIRALREFRAACRRRELQIAAKPSCRETFSRDEFFERNKMWF